MSLKDDEIMLAYFLHENQKFWKEQMLNARDLRRLNNTKGSTDKTIRQRELEFAKRYWEANREYQEFKKEYLKDEQ